MTIRIAAVLSTLILIAGCSCPSGGGGMHKTLGSIIRKDPRFDKLIPPGAQMEVLAGGFDWTTYFETVELKPSPWLNVTEPALST